MKTKVLFGWIIAYAVAMAFLESAVVIWIREVLYPDGFSFPLTEMDPGMAVTEIIREAATMIMLVSVAAIAGSHFTERFAWFILAFGVWDIFYYIFLWILIGWPGSVMDWDVLFLIPVTWTGPVITPVIISLLMIFLGVVIVRGRDKGVRIVLKGWHWILLIAGSLIVITAFAMDYSRFVLKHYTISELINLPDSDGLFRLALSYEPERFSWLLFVVGALVISVVPFNLLIRKTGEKK
jgi:hypothetical protein